MEPGRGRWDRPDGQGAWPIYFIRHTPRNSAPPQVPPVRRQLKLERGPRCCLLLFLAGIRAQQRGSCSLPWFQLHRPGSGTQLACAIWEAGVGVGQLASRSVQPWARAGREGARAGLSRQPEC